MKRRGITLVELVVVMVIIAIGAVLIAPNIGTWIPHYRLQSAARDVVSTLRTAQMRAISTNAQYRVSFDTAAGSYILQYQNTGGKWIDEGDAQSLPSGIIVSGITLSGNNANFYPNSTSSPGSITLANPRGFSKTVTLAAFTGQAHVQ